MFLIGFTIFVVDVENVFAKNDKIIIQQISVKNT